VTPDEKISVAPKIKAPNVLGAVVSAVRGSKDAIKTKWRRMWQPKVYQRHEAPAKWHGSSMAWEEVPVNRPPHAGDTVRVSGLNAMEYNGVRGLVKEGPNEKQRYLVQVVIQEQKGDVEAETKELSLREDNLMVVEEVEAGHDMNANQSWRSKPSDPSSPRPEVIPASKPKPKPKTKSKGKGKPPPPTHGRTYRSVEKAKKPE